MTTQIANKAADCAAFKLNGVKACTAAAGNNMVQVCVMRVRVSLAIHPAFVRLRFPFLYLYLCLALVEIAREYSRNRHF